MDAEDTRAGNRTTALTDAEGLEKSSDMGKGLYMDAQAANRKIISKLLFRLLPVQVLLAAVGAVNGIVSSFFATNYVGVDAMSAVGLYNPLNLLMTAISTTLVGGSAILCGKYLGRNQQEKLRNVFSLDLAVSVLISVVFVALYLFWGMSGMVGFFTRDAAVRPLFCRYLLGQAVGLLPFVLGNQLSAFLSIENKGSRTMMASLGYIGANLALNVLFVKILRLDALGLALATSLGMWLFLAVQAQYFLSGRSHLKVQLRGLDWREIGEILRIGLPGALGTAYQTVRGLIVNWLLELFVGAVGISAFAAANNVMGIFWAIPAGMLAVSRLMISVSIGEEDRQTLTDVMRVMFRRFIPLMCVVEAGIILCAVPLTRMFFRDPSEAVYGMTVWGLRILPLCMSFSIICMHFVCYGQASGKRGLVHLLSVLDGAVCVAAFTALLIRPVGMNSVYIANVLNGVVTTIVIVGFSVGKKKRLPRNMDDLMVIPEDFGTPESQRLDLTVRSMEEVVTIAERVQRFCRERGVDPKRSYMAGLALEEMAGNIVDHGFTKGTRSHSIDVRVALKGEDVILRLRDDCVPFDPGERQQMTEDDDPFRNIGIRMVYQIAREIEYQNMLGLNVLTMRI